MSFLAHMSPILLAKNLCVGVQPPELSPAITQKTETHSLQRRAQLLRGCSTMRLNVLVPQAVYDSLKTETASLFFDARSHSTTNTGWSKDDPIYKNESKQS